jgi:perosamine synthetase
MELKRTFGEHRVYTYDKHKHKFHEFFTTLYNTDALDKLHLTSEEYQKEGLQDVETDLHKLFYKKIKSDNEFKALYCNLIKDIHGEFFKDSPWLVYQSFPSVRFQFVNNTAVPPHCDSDNLGKHPLGEKNFLLPITRMFETNRLFVESAPGAADFSGIDLEYGELLFFNGNKCIHYNMSNKTECLRISLDFRVLTPEDYKKYIVSGSITNTNPRDPEKSRVPVKMTIGGYYQLTHIDDSLDTMMRWHFQKDMLLQSQPQFDDSEAQACYDYIKSGGFVTEFKKTMELERAIASFTGSKHAIMTTSGNMALILALLACNIKRGDEVIVPNYTMIATVNSIQMVGATPIIVDVDPHTLTLGLDEIKSARTENTRAVIHVSLNNRHAGLEDIAAYCKSNNMYLIEDAAQSMGCFLREGTHFGTVGDIGCFSLSTPKIISTGQGGFLITNNDELARHISIQKNFGRVSGGVDIFETFGVNAKFTDIQAVIGIEQMKKLPERVKRMRDIFDTYYKYLHRYMIPAQSSHWIPWFVDIFTSRRDELVEFLKIHNIQTRSTYPEINKTPMYADSRVLPVSERISKEGLFLPTHMVLTDSQIEHISRLICFHLEE